jgi:ubiquinone/menaquinone biosynthesis C-methylase UbiE
MANHVCPWWLAYTFDNPLRRFFHDPEKIFFPHLKEGMTAVDFGCGMGYFSIAMAKIVGEAGRIIAVDLQQQMLDVMQRRAQKAGVAERITPVLCNSRETGVTIPADFSLAFWMVHETPDAAIFLKQVHAILKNSGRLLLAEPKMHDPCRNLTRSPQQPTESAFRRQQCLPSASRTRHCLSKSRHL